MDLSTMEQRLNNLEYEAVDDFISDMNLIFSNCYLYNGTEALVSQCASNVEAAFNKLLRRMPKEVRRENFGLNQNVHVQCSNTYVIL